MWAAYAPANTGPVNSAHWLGDGEDQRRKENVREDFCCFSACSGIEVCDVLNRRHVCAHLPKWSYFIYVLVHL